MMNLTYLNPSLDGSNERLVARRHPPPPGFITLNVDGSFMEESLNMGSSGLLRNESGSWIIGFSSFEGQGDMLLAELLALKHGLALAWDQGFRHVVCEFDALDIVNLFNANENLQLHSFAKVVIEIAELLNQNWIVKLLHVFRETNACANFLAKLGVRSSQPWKTWLDPPPLLGSLLLKDSLGIDPPG